MRKVIMAILTIFAIFGFTGCMDKERIPAGYDAKILTSDGYAPEVLHSGAVKVCGLFDFNCYNKLILLEKAKKQFIEKTVTVRMKDNMDLQAQYVRVVVQPKKDTKTLNQLFNDIKPNQDGVITLNAVYEVYGKPKVMRIIREVLSKYTIDEARLNYARISGEIFNRLAKEFNNTPLQLVDFSLGKFVYPKVYNEAIETAKKRELEIKKAQADAAIAQTRAAAKIKIAKAEYAVKMQEARRIADYNKMVGNSVTPQLLQLRKLEVQQAMVDAVKGNQNVIYMPYDMMNNSNFLIQKK